MLSRISGKPSRHRITRAGTLFEPIRNIYNICTTITAKYSPIPATIHVPFSFRSLSSSPALPRLIFYASEVGYCFLICSLDCVHSFWLFPSDQSFSTFLEYCTALYTYDTSFCFSVGSVRRSFVMFGRRSPSLSYPLHLLQCLFAHTFAITVHVLFHCLPSSWFFEPALFVVYPALDLFIYLRGRL